MRARRSIKIHSLNSVLSADHHVFLACQSVCPRPISFHCNVQMMRRSWNALNQSISGIWWLRNFCVVIDVGDNSWSSLEDAIYNDDNKPLFFCSRESFERRTISIWLERQNLTDRPAERLQVKLKRSFDHSGTTFAQELSNSEDVPTGRTAFGVKRKEKKDDDQQ